MAEVEVMASIPQIDQALLAHLPPKAKLKIQRLIDIAKDCESAFATLIARQERLREELGILKSQQQASVERARQLGTEPKDAAAEYTPAIQELEGELQRLDKDRARREQRRFDSAQLVAQLRQFLSDAINGRKIFPLGMPVKPEMAQGDDPPAAVKKIRAQITHLQQQLAAMRRAALPASELKAKAWDYVRALAAAGTPSLHVQDAKFEVRFEPGATQPMGTVGPGSLAIMCWLFPDQVIARLDALIDATVKGSGLPAGKRGYQEFELQGRLINLERLEEAIISKFETDLPELLRRPNADPLAVLEMHFGSAGLQTRKAS
jgi:hypothetical protein